MICPNCKTKADEGARLCRACHETLDSPESDAQFVTVLETFNMGDMLIIKSILDSEGIDYYVLGEMSYSFLEFTQPYILRVSYGQVELARELLADFL